MIRFQNSWCGVCNKRIYSKRVYKKRVYKKHVMQLLKSARVFLRVWVLLPVFFLLSCATPPGGIDNWPITNAEANTFSGQVVDMLCQVNGNCVDNCGSGKRQLGIETADLGTVLVAKNLNNYTGSVDELLQFCGQIVEVNGLFTEHKGIRFFQVQNMRSPGGEWEKATRYAKAWAQRSGNSPSLAGNWQNHDQRVKAVIERDGVLGLGKEADDAYLK